MIQKSRKFLTPLLATAVAFATIIPDASADTPVVSQQANGTVITSPADISSLDTDASGNHAPSVTPDDDQGNAETIPVAGGQQTVFTIDSPESSHIRTFDLGLPDGAIIVERDGFFFVEQDGQITIRISDPWAKDANGNAVNTWFTTDGKTLTQHVEKDESAVYPITVDPRWTWGVVSGHVYFSKEETRKLAAGGAATAAVGPFWLAVPAPFGPAIAAWWAKNSIHVTETATRAVAGNKCAQLKVGYIGAGSGVIGVTPDEYTNGCA